MRLWSLHPRFLDAKGLVALWREGLLARAVLSGRTRGYRHHPQLARFLATDDPVWALDLYLSRVLDESRARAYRFDETKIRYRSKGEIVGTVTEGQVNHEWKHLLRKLRVRDPERHRALRLVPPRPHPVFRLIAGGIEPWEKRVRSTARRVKSS